MSRLVADGEPGTDALAGMSKIVFSSTLSEPMSLPNTRLITREPVEAVREMKDHGTESMRTLGSLTLCRSLLAAGLVDRFRVVVFPVITGRTGRDRIYDGKRDSTGGELPRSSRRRRRSGPRSYSGSSSATSTVIPASSTFAAPMPTVASSTPRPD